MTWPSTFDASHGARYSPATIGVMIDESFSRVTNAIRPPGRSIVTSELSIDLVEMTGSGDGPLSCDANAVAVSPNAALAHSTLQDAHRAVVATASTWCRFIKGGHDENHAYPQAAKPPPDLALHRLLTTTLSPDDDTVTARFTPDDQCTNDLGTLHGGIAVAAALEVGLTWLRMIYGGTDTEPHLLSLRTAHESAVTTPAACGSECLHQSEDGWVVLVVGSACRPAWRLTGRRSRVRSAVSRNGPVGSCCPGRSSIPVGARR